MFSSSGKSFDIQPWKLDTRFHTDGERVIHIIPNTIEVWKVHEVIGEGGYGVVSRQICIQGPSEGESRAVKRIPNTPELRRDIVREIEALATFSSKYPEYFVRFLGWYEEMAQREPSLHIVMEYAPYGDLNKCLQNRPCRESEATRITTQVARALKYMHDMDFIHRDLKLEVRYQ